MTIDNNKMKQTSTFKSTKPRDFTDNKGRGSRYIWEITPVVWGNTWGNKPMLGYVKADDAYHACYAAWDKGLAVEWNYPFGVEATKATKFIRGFV